MSHLAVGALCGAAFARTTGAKPGRSMAAFAALALSPDLDFFAAEIGLNDTPLHHRVMTHSLPFAAVTGLMIGIAVGRRPHRRAAIAASVAALASHGLLDALTQNLPGPQLLWPLTTWAIQFPWHPIPGTRFYQQYFTAAAIPVVSVEALMSLPFLALAVWLVRRPGGTVASRRSQPP